MPSEDMTQEKKTTHQDSASSKDKSNMEITWNYDIIDFLNEQMKHIDPNNVNLPDKEGDPVTTPSRLINTVDPEWKNPSMNQTTTSSGSSDTYPK